MLRKILLPTLLCITSTSACAGFYLGAGMGPDTANFEQTAYITNPHTRVKDTTHLAGKGYFGSLFGGYAWLINQFFIAAEVNANISSDTFNSTNSEFIHQSFAKAEYRMRSSYGISALPGYLYANRTLFYGRLGYNSGNFQVVTHDPSLGNVSRHLNGFRYGLGISERLTDQLSVRLEYGQVLYQNTILYTFQRIGSTAKTTRISPTVSQVEFGLIYNIV